MHSSWSLLPLVAAVVSAAPSRPHILPRAPADAPTVNLKNGSYYGVHNSQFNQDFFLGIPFAQPPIEQRRFANPETLNLSWTGALPATNFAFVCCHAFDLCVYVNADTLVPGVLWIWR
jgi:hypothetical protein